MADLPPVIARLHKTHEDLTLGNFNLPDEPLIINRSEVGVFTDCLFEATGPFSSITKSLLEQNLKDGLLRYLDHPVVVLP